jgi:hypothetical protein
MQNKKTKSTNHTKSINYDAIIEQAETLGDHKIDPSLHPHQINGKNVHDIEKSLENFIKKK